MSSATESRTAFDVSTVEFREHCEHLAGQGQQLLVLTAEIAKLQKGQSLAYPDGRKLGKKELRSLQSQFLKEIKALPKYFNQAKKPKKTRRTGGAGGLKNPIIISDNMKAFFNEADLGQLYIKKAEKKVAEDGSEVEEISWGAAPQPLKSYLQLLLTNGITSPSMLTPLFTIYATLNKMQDVSARQYYKATPLMHKHFGSTFTELTRQTTEAPGEDTVSKKVGDKVVKEKVVRPPFSPDRFKFYRFNSLVSQNKKKELSEAEKAELAKPEVLERLAQEQSFVSHTNEYHKMEREDKRKAEKAAAKPAKAAPKKA